MDLRSQGGALDHERLETRANLIPIARGGGALLGDGEVDDVHHHRLTLLVGQRDGCRGSVGCRRDRGPRRAG